MSNKISILHITPHLGGGMGRVLLNYLIKVKDDDRFTHQVSCLDYANDNAVSVAKDIGLTLTDKMDSNREQLLSMISGVDIVLFHWINHPLLYDFMVREELPPCRVIIWSHISGFHPPYVFTKKILRYPDLFVFTSPISYETEDVQNLSDEMKGKLRVVWSTGGVEHVKNVIPEVHIGFNVGYIGTVDYCKMRPDFLNICSQIDIPDVRFIICGGAKEKEIQQEAKYLGISSKFRFTGLVSDITKYLSVFDVFGYPLASYHYGTCDQVLAESMACGVVPVVFSNRMEKQMVQDGVTGLVVDNKEEYCNAIKRLYNDKKLKEFLSQNAKKYACEEFTLDKIEHEWSKVFREIMQSPKIARKWENNQSIVSSKDVFLESLGDYGEEFISYCNAANDRERAISSMKIKELAISPVWQARTKGTVHHYSSFFPKDEYLATWSGLMK